jgi:multimeric flavodoxin WrbA
MNTIRDGDNMIPNILGIIGSPRSGGNTDILIDEVLAGATAEGAFVDKAYLSKINISSCRGCETCAKTKKCAIQDDMPNLLAKMDHCDIWVLGTPVYFWGPTGWFKSYVDRWHGAKYSLDFKKKSVVLVIPFEDTKLATAHFTVGMLQKTFEYLGITLIESILAPGVFARGCVKEHPDILMEAYRIGQKVIKAID